MRVPHVVSPSGFTARPLHTHTHTQRHTHIHTHTHTHTHTHQARHLDGPRRACFQRLEASYFLPALRLHPQHTLSLLCAALAAQTGYGFFEDELPSAKPAPPTAALSPKPRHHKATQPLAQAVPVLSDDDVRVFDAWLACGWSDKARARRACGLMRHLAYSRWAGGAGYTYMLCRRSLLTASHNGGRGFHSTLHTQHGTPPPAHPP
jgi:hypothetical protein